MSLETYIVDNIDTVTSDSFLALATDTDLPLYVIYTPLITLYDNTLASANDCDNGIFVLDIYGESFNDVLILSEQLRELFDNRDMSTLKNQMDLSSYTGDDNNSIRYRISQQYNFTLETD